MDPVRVVVVEDNEVFRETLQLLLQLRGDIDVVALVSTGDAAPAVCADLMPDVVLMDYRMPGLNGTQATEAVLREAPGVQVVCLTASVSKLETDQLLAAGAFACVMKDDDLEEIVRAIHDAAGRPATA